MKLFEPIQVGPLTLANRIVLPAMVTRLSGEDGHVNQDIEERYVRFARGEPGLIVVEAMGISQSKSGPLLRISSAEYLPGLRRLARRVHETAPVKVVAQIIHFLKISRSGWRQTIMDLTVAEIRDIVAQFAAAAGRAREAGFDGVELHMAHAYTMSSFLSRMNRRRDDYGGSLDNRLRAPSEVLKAVKATVGDDFLVGVRFDGEECIKDGYSLPDAQQIALRLARLGAHYLSISAGGKFEDAVKKPGVPIYPYTGYSGDRCMPGKGYPDGFNLYLGEGIKQVLVAHGFPEVRVVATGKIWRPEHAEEIVTRRTDLVGMARQLLADPDWPRKVRDGRADSIIFCEYGNVCKALDESFQKVRCTLWPKDALHAPLSAKAQDAPPPQWPPGGARLRAHLEHGKVRLNWERAVDPEASLAQGSPDGAGGIYGYEVLRAEGEAGTAALAHHASIRAATPTFLDVEVLGGVRYTYAVKPYDRRGVRGPCSEPVSIELPPP
ncbi:MAG: NADH:flavin oxidoreductase [Myxococcales bacterium]|nr:NADH:flavin oxidoreductase [Myxococcota bacterium]MDW8282515.1 NADH:flavin oxidoreductase [Myxococcales bacterium]